MAKREPIEYTLGKRTETPFQTFLRYTDEKPQSARVLGQVLEGELLQEGMSFLDIGSGTGDYLQLALGHFNCPSSTRFTLLEPSSDLLTALTDQVGQFPDPAKVEIVQATLEGYETAKPFDIALAAHLYHIPSEEMPNQFLKMLQLVKPGGTLLYVLREIDDAYKFKMEFKSKLFGESFQAQTLQGNLQIFQQLAQQIPIDITTYRAQATLEFPLDNMDETQAIIEFFLNKRWQEIPEVIQEEALQFIQARNGVFQAIDGIASIKRK